MKSFVNVSAIKISWIKSDLGLENIHGIEHLYFPETIEELQNLLFHFISSGCSFDVIGYSSNVLFMPSYRMENVICTKYLNRWIENENEIICDCGVSVIKLARYAVEQGYAGFEGLTDLPGTIAAGVYGNSGCRGCSVNSLVKSFTLINEKGEIKQYSVDDLKLKYRSTSLKRGEIRGTIISVTLKKSKDNPVRIKQLALMNHQIRKEQQPSGRNNLGTTYIATQPTIKGSLVLLIEKIIMTLRMSRDSRKSFPLVLRLLGKKEFVPYIYYWNRYMFIDEKSHVIFPQYTDFLRSLYRDVHFEIEIRK